LLKYHAGIVLTELTVIDRFEALVFDIRLLSSSEVQKLVTGVI
jgi:hypothetical protein